MATPRRQVLAFFLLGIGFSAGVSRFLRNRPSRLEFEPIPDVPGYRRVRTGALSGGGSDPFIGLGGSQRTSAKGDLSDLHVTHKSDGQVSVASFSDYNCPYCRVLTDLVADEEETGRIAVTWHELPLLGSFSVAAAKAALAAGLQGAYLPFHRHMMASRFRPTEPYLAEAARSLGLNEDQLLADMNGKVVADQLRRTSGLARMLGIYGTPALIVGRTLVLGEISRADLRQLIALEAGM